MTFVGLDPSFTGYGIALIHSDTKSVDFMDIDTEFDKHNARLKFDAIKTISRNAIRKVSTFSSDKIYLGQEVSTAYTGWMVAELFGLAYATYQTILNKLNPIAYNLYSQTYINYVHGKRKRTKEETIFMIEDVIIPIFEKHGYTVNKYKTAMTSTGEKEEGKNRYIRRETITNNEADAMIYALRMFIKYSNEKEIIKEILDWYPRFNDDNHELA